jgi:hypothetical protein
MFVNAFLLRFSCGNIKGWTKPFQRQFYSTINHRHISLWTFFIQCSQCLFKLLLSFLTHTHTHMHFRRYANEFLFFPTPWKLLKSLQQDWLPPPTVSAPLQTKQTETKGSTSHLERNFNNEPVLLQNWRKGEKWNWTPTNISKIVPTFFGFMNTIFKTLFSMIPKNRNFCYTFE